MATATGGGEISRGGGSEGFVFFLKRFFPDKCLGENPKFDRALVLDELRQMSCHVSTIPYKMLKRNLSEMVCITIIICAIIKTMFLPPSRTKRESAAWKLMKAAFKGAERRKRNSGPCSFSSSAEDRGNVMRSD